MISIGSMSAFSSAGGAAPIHPAHPRPLPVRTQQSAPPPATPQPGLAAPAEGSRTPPRILPRGSLLDLSV